MSLVCYKCEREQMEVGSLTIYERRALCQNCIREEEKGK